MKKNRRGKNGRKARPEKKFIQAVHKKGYFHCASLAASRRKEGPGKMAGLRLDRGKKAGWHGGNLPPGQAKKKGGPPEYAPQSRHQWTEQERHRYEERIGDAERKIRELIEKKRNIPAQMLDSATLSLFSATSQGVPVATASAIIEQGIEQGLSPEGIESVTRALSHGVERQADFGELEKIIHAGMNRGLTEEELTMEVYRALSR